MIILIFIDYYKWSILLSKDLFFWSFRLLILLFYFFCKNGWTFFLQLENILQNVVVLLFTPFNNLKWFATLYNVNWDICIISSLGYRAVLLLNLYSARLLILTLLCSILCVVIILVTLGIVIIFFLFLNLFRQILCVLLLYFKFSQGTFITFINLFFAHHHLV